MKEDTTSTPPVILTGRLEGILIPELLWELRRERKTGLLHIQRGPVRKSLFIDQGSVVFVRSSDPNDRLGEMLLRKGRVTLDSLEKALREQCDGKRLGTLLVEAESLSAEMLACAVRDQIETIVLDVLDWEVGDYDFAEGPLPAAEEITLDATTEELLLDATRRHRSFERLRRRVGTSRAVYRLTPGATDVAEALPLSDGERLVLHRIAGGSVSIETLCRELTLASFEIYRSLWAFKILGLIHGHGHTTEDVAGEGRLEHKPLPELLVELSAAESTGVLYLHFDGTERSIHMRGGRCVFATSNDPDDSLVTHLFRRGVISLADRDEATKRLLSTKRVGTILRDLGAIDDNDLRESVREQVSEIICDSFSWSDGDYLFISGTLPATNEMALELDVAALIAEGVHRVRSWTRIIRGCGGVDNPLMLEADYLQILDRIGAGVEEWEVVNTLKHPQTPRRVCRLCNLEDFRVCQILWTLKLLGAVTERPIELDEELDEELNELEIAAAPPVEADGAEAPVSADVATSEVVAELRELPDKLSGMPPTSELPDESEPTPDESPSDEPEDELDDWDGPANLDHVIQRFNSMHRVLYGVVRKEIGAGAVNFIRSCCGDVVGDALDIFDGVELRPDGTWDEQALRRRVIRGRVEDPWPVYQGVLDREYLQLKPHLGESRATELKQQIWELHQAAQPG